MSGYRSAEEAKLENVRHLGPALGPLYNSLEDEVTWLHARWLEFKKLYVSSASTTDLLNRVAPYFFYVVQVALWNEMLMHIARLTDPPTQGKHRNLTLLGLSEVIEHGLLRDEVKAHIEDACEKARFARTWRNRYLAHRDLAIGMGDSPTSLPDASIDMVESVLCSFRNILNSITGALMDSEVAYDFFVSSEDAETMVFYLERGVTAVEQEEGTYRKWTSPSS